MIRTSAHIALCAFAIGALAYGAGCSHEPWDQPISDSEEILVPEEPLPGEMKLIQPVPKPINLLLPNRIAIHPFTGTQIVDRGRPVGIEARIKALDAYGDPTKAFGHFRFTLYAYRALSQSPRGRQMAVWDEFLLDPKPNRRHWDPISQAYKFDLRWAKPLMVGQRYVLEVYFSSPFTDQLFDQRVFVAGQ
jgi:hypothetical protein